MTAYPTSIDLARLDPKGRRATVTSRWPTYEDDEIAAVVDVLRAGRVNALHHGEVSRRFESAFAEFCGARYAVAVGNGTLALELALNALGVGRGDEVVVTPRSFIASAACVVRCGATPVFADVDRDSQCITAASVEAALTERTKAVIPVHLAGWPCAMDDLVELARVRNLLLIEDCAQAHGATWRGRRVGSFGEAAAFSFCTDKIMSTGGEGGMLLLRSEESWRRAWSFKDHGKDVEKHRSPWNLPEFRWLHDTCGTNWRLTEMQAAIGLRQLDKLEHWLVARRDNARCLTESLADLAALRLTIPPPEAGHAYYKYYTFIRPERLKPRWDRRRILQTLAARGIPVGTGVCPEIYREQAFLDLGFAPQAPLPMARELGETSLMFPIDHTLGRTAMARIAEEIRHIAHEATL